MLDMILQSYSFSAVLKLIISAVLGAALGFERTRKLRPAGFRTYSLVSISACATVIIGEYLFMESGTGDISRIAAAVISGIGFLGAGTIITSGRHKILGLTTAAGLWVSACAGLAVGSGFYLGAVALILITMLMLIQGEKFQTKRLRASRRLRLFILFTSLEHAVSFLHAMQTEGIEVSNIEFIEVTDTIVSATIDFDFGKKRVHSEFISTVQEREGVLFLNEN